MLTQFGTSFLLKKGPHTKIQPSSSSDAMDWRRGPPRVAQEGTAPRSESKGREDGVVFNSEPTPEWADDDDIVVSTPLEDSSMGMFDMAGNFLATAKTDV